MSILPFLGLSFMEYPGIRIILKSQKPECHVYNRIVTLFLTCGNKMSKTTSPGSLYVNIYFKFVNKIYVFLLFVYLYCFFFQFNYRIDLFEKISKGSHSWHQIWLPLMQIQGVWVFLIEGLREVEYVYKKIVKLKKSRRFYYN